MATVHDVAAYILKNRGPISAMKLHKLVYYCQAWSLAWEDRPIFPEQIQAWVNGPVVPAIYEKHRGEFMLNEWITGDVNALIASDRETIDIVLASYADKDAQYLSDLTHKEDPWRLARRGLAPSERGCSEITLASMMEYYSSIPADE